MQRWNTQRWNTVAIIGVGLLGGSIGLALRKRKLAKTVIGIGRKKGSLAKALSRQCVTKTTTSVAKGVAAADLIIICTPVETVAQFAAEAAKACPAGAIITDVGSTKVTIVREAEAEIGKLTKKQVAFIGSHPLAGSEKTGCEAAQAELFKDRLVIVTPTAKTHPDAIERISGLWKALGGKVASMSPDDHDAVLARTSHLPHLIASVLAAATPGGLVSITGAGWRDTTRIAAGDAELWRQILLANAGHTLSALDDFERVLSWFRSAMQTGDGQALAELLQQGKVRRDAVGS
jgi:prephenate dehydrogenase